MSGRGEPVFSVCIANFNGADCLAGCIESVLRQIDAPTYEIIVHDDASTDGSWRIAGGYPSVRLVRSASNAGFCVANNRMVEIASGRFLLLLNNDAELLPDALSTLAGVLESSRAPGVATLPQYDFLSGELLDAGMDLDLFLNPIPRALSGARGGPGMVMGSCLAIPRWLWDRAGGFPTFFESIAEDMYLCLYATILGMPVTCAPRSGYRHRVGKSFGGGKVVDDRLLTSYRRRALSERNKTFNLCMFYPAGLLALALPLHLLALAVEGLALALAHRSLEPVRRIYLPLPLALASNLATLRTYRARIARDRVIGSLRFLRGLRLVPRKLQLLHRFGFPRIH